ncbi:MAG TPA: UDP-N-acetylmuramoyl-L-alanyl-D-glutamate--2,6-diaminopimelate ligase [Syntrophorhabdaceae bacterium]|nr:UDP-N-acetylmuramoyl-L-alanyl-D-glutamate--2,6-diaminopimelate ligase [Syntrophorhabdaceae bacterium]HOS05830.1 UDP-N-acetylmuramoyl-L-alanyl-D-glutamate--2,6-diaminopimelate ligase [Syntrophorhabdaceae bacterium]HPL41124.1 UDP-N-acetylmuramoyl-L-alanyl-D-glutamate--2,6-diaminopimelate ligase [Syntrophorhabdaceae bacterium]
MILRELIDGLSVIDIKGNTNIEVKGITKDSRRTKEGFMFFSTDKSEKYVKDAVLRGAIAVVTDSDIPMNTQCSIVAKDIKGMLGKVASRFYGSPSKGLVVIGITGTNGKTTTSYLIESILISSGKNTGLIGTISHKYDGRTLKAENTTPGAEELQCLLRDMLSAKTEYVVMEVSSHALDQKRVEDIHFDTAILTNMTHDHLDYHKSFEQYREAKRLLFKNYLQNSLKQNRYAILNMDEPFVTEFIPDEPINTLYYSLSKNTNAYLVDCVEDINGLQLTCSVMGETFSVKTPMIGVFNASNILAASLFGYTAKISKEFIISGIERLSGVPGRLERVKNNKGINVFVDYAHTPDALKNVLETLNRLKPRRLIIVFGCGGDRDKAKRPIMGNIASRFADFSIITTDNPRSEAPPDIIDQITNGFQGNHFKVVENRKEAIFEGLRISRENDVLLVAGKGHEDYQIIGQEVFHFSDKEVIEEFIDVAD